MERFRVTFGAGHGGLDTGFVGPGGLPEKSAALQTAQTAADLLNRSEEFDARLTRTGDYFQEESENGTLAVRQHSACHFELHCAEDSKSLPVVLYSEERQTDAKPAAHMAARLAAALGMEGGRAVPAVAQSGDGRAALYAACAGGAPHAFAVILPPLADEASVETVASALVRTAAELFGTEVPEAPDFAVPGLAAGAAGTEKIGESSHEGGGKISSASGGGRASSEGDLPAKTRADAPAPAGKLSETPSVQAGKRIPGHADAAAWSREWTESKKTARAEAAEAPGRETDAWEMDVAHEANARASEGVSEKKEGSLPEEAGGWETVAPGLYSVRKAPDDTSGTIGMLRGGERFETRVLPGGYRQITLLGRTGYAPPWAFTRRLR